MTTIRWCFTHDERVPPRTEWCDLALQTMTQSRPVSCDIRDAVVLPKGESPVIRGEPVVEVSYQETVDMDDEKLSFWHVWTLQGDSE